MSEAVDYRHHIDPEYRRWSRKYSRFPGVAECIRLLRSRNVHGAWIDIIAYELAAHAEESLVELIAVFRTEESESIRLFVLTAIADANLPSAVRFLAEVVRERESDLALIAERGLLAIAIGRRRPRPPDR